MVAAELIFDIQQRYPYSLFFLKFMQQRFQHHPVMHGISPLLKISKKRSVRCSVHTRAVELRVNSAFKRRKRGEIKANKLTLLRIQLNPFAVGLDRKDWNMFPIESNHTSTNPAPASDLGTSF